MTDSKVVLITGCSSGIGRALALEFNKHNCRVFASARTISKLEDLRDYGIDLVQLDVTNDDSMEVDNTTVFCFRPFSKTV
jgi:1-acylglycerone phosphate reductase